MNNFEERLLGELRSAVADREVAPEVQPRRHVPRRRIAIAAAACAALAVGASVVVPSLGGETAAEAFAVSQGPDGKVTVKIYRGEVDAEALERRIESYGVKAEVDFLPAGQWCTYRPSTGKIGGTYQITDFWGSSEPPGTMGFIFDPKVLRDDTLVVEGSGWFAGTGTPGRGAGLKVGLPGRPGPAVRADQPPTASADPLTDGVRPASGIDLRTPGRAQRRSRHAGDHQDGGAAA